MRRSRSLLIMCVLLAAVAPLGACGGSPKKSNVTRQQMEKEAAKRRAIEAAKKTTDPNQVESIRVENPRWDEHIRPYFEKYLGQKHTTPKNAFEPQILALIPRPVIEESEDTEEVETTEVEEVEAEERGPLQQHPLKDYDLLLIMSGTAVPKAVVKDPRGNAFVVQLDTRIGDKNGIVEAITQYMVVVREPNEDKPTKLTIKPAYVDLASSMDVEELVEESGEGGAFPSAVLPEAGGEPLAPLPEE